MPAGSIRRSPRAARAHATPPPVRCCGPAFSARNLILSPPTGATPWRRSARPEETTATATASPDGPIPPLDFEGRGTSQRLVEGLVETRTEPLALSPLVGENWREGCAARPREGTAPR